MRCVCLAPDPTSQVRSFAIDADTGFVFGAYSSATEDELCRRGRQGECSAKVLEYYGCVPCVVRFRCLTPSHVYRSWSTWAGGRAFLEAAWFVRKAADLRH